MSLKPGAELDLDVEKAAAGGRMLTRHAGQVVLVSGAIPGERIRARIERVAKGVTYAETLAVLTPSPDRRPLSGDPRCGGQSLAHIGYRRQVQLKAEIIQDAFRRIARVPLPAPPPMLSAAEDGYRMRARLHVHDARIGFFLEGTHQVCGAAQTRQLSTGAIAWIAEAEATMRHPEVAGLTALEITENIAGTQLAVHLELQAGAEPAAFASVASPALTGLSAQAADARVLTVVKGDTRVTDVLGVAPGVSLSLSRDVRAFFQANRYLVEPLVTAVIGMLGDAPIVDLYAGVGLFGLSAAAAGHRVVTLVEGDPISGADLVRNAAPFANRAIVERRSVESFLGSRAAVDGATVIVDPPRTGMSRDAIRSLREWRARRLIYVSCDVATLARDTRILLDAGYELDSIVGVDMFPNTAHVESIVQLTKT